MFEMTGLLLVLLMLVIVGLLVLMLLLRLEDKIPFWRWKLWFLSLFGNELECLTSPLPLSEKIITHHYNLQGLFICT